MCCYSKFHELKHNCQLTRYKYCVSALTSIVKRFHFPITGTFASTHSDSHTHKLIFTTTKLSRLPFRMLAVRVSANLHRLLRCDVRICHTLTSRSGASPPLSHPTRSTSQAPSGDPRWPRRWWWPYSDEVHARACGASSRVSSLGDDLTPVCGDAWVHAHGCMQLSKR